MYRRIVTSKKLCDSSVTFLNILTDDKRKLVEYAGNKNLYIDFTETDFRK